MQVLAFSIGAAAFAGALRIALVVAGSRRDRIGRFLIRVSDLVVDLE